MRGTGSEFVFLLEQSCKESEKRFFKFEYPNPRLVIENPKNRIRYYHDFESKNPNPKQQRGFLNPRRIRIRGGSNGGGVRGVEIGQKCILGVHKISVQTTKTAFFIFC